MSAEPNGIQSCYTETEVSGGSGDQAATLPPQFQTGDVLDGRFEIVRFLARGGMGEVYEAKDRLLHNSRVALKTIGSRSALDPEARRRLKEEVMLAREVTHPNVCPIYDVFECEQPVSACFLTMKLLRGETLAQRFARGQPLSHTEALIMIRQLCSALSAAHAARVVHRDLKPGNIFLQGSEAALKTVVADFGIAFEYKPDRTVTVPWHIAGTPGYIAPEVMAGEAATPASDLYSLGVVLHEVITGHKPAAASAQDTLSFEELEKQKFPVWCLRFIAGCLDANPQVRQREFDRAIDHLGLDETLPSGSAEHFRFSRRKLLRMGTAAASTLAGVLLWEERAKILHPLPRKRFVALIEFPPPSDRHVSPLVQGVIEAIESALSRAEAFDRDLCVMAVRSVKETALGAALRAVRDSSGANLALAAHGKLNGNNFHLTLTLLDSSTSAVLRRRELVTSQSEIQSSARAAVAASAALLNVHLRANSPDQPSFATTSEQAYKSFQTAEDLMKQPNDAGLENAMESYRDAVNADPGYAIAHARLAIAYCRYYALHGDPAALELAKRNAEKGLKLDPRLVDGHVALSGYYDWSGNKQAALNEIAKALALDPTNPRTLFWQAQIYRRMRRWSDAEEIYKRIIDQRPNYWVAYNDLGFVLNAQGRYREAIEAFRSETVVNPHSYLAFSNLGDLCFKLGDSAEAKWNYHKSLELSPNEWAYSGLGEVLRAEANYAGALPIQLHAVELNPSNDVNWLDLGDCYASLKQEKQARDAYLRAKKQVEASLQQDPTDAGAMLRLALYDLKTNQPGDPIAVIAKANTGSLDLDSQVIEIRIFVLLGKHDRAIALLGQCFEKGLTRIEIAAIPDFQALKKDVAFSRLVAKH
jgi:tetratricopeptide (TPR) repeat protein